MTQDTLVERLREYDRKCAARMAGALMVEAADRITDLESEVAEEHASALVLAKDNARLREALGEIIELRPGTGLAERIARKSLRHD